jgi:Arylsulfotransferase (ASST)
VSEDGVTVVARDLRSVAVPAVGLVVIAFAGGLVLGLLRLWPAPLAQTVLTTLGDLRTNITQSLENRPVQHLSPRHHPGDGVTGSDPAQMQPGVTLLSGLFGNTLGFRLYANDGTLLHEWPIDFFKVAPDEMDHRFHALIHGEVMFENGDIAANLDGRGIVRFDRCGKVIWRNHAKSHHSMWVDDAGLLWTPVHGDEYHRPAMSPLPFTIDRIASFDPATGEMRDNIDLVDQFAAADLSGLIAVTPDNRDDLAHINDAEVLSAALAPAFPMFRAGDILVSSRNLRLIMVLDGTTHRIKWRISGATVGQHDPDFQPDGTITVLDNRPMGTADESTSLIGNRGGSRILSIDPATNRTRTLYETTPDNTFYTPYRGKHQMLPNGNILIAETDEGRAFEVTPSGKVVWMFVNGYDDDNIGWIMGAHRYPESFATAASRPCEG